MLMPPTWPPMISSQNMTFSNPGVSSTLAGASQFVADQQFPAGSSFPSTVPPMAGTRSTVGFDQTDSNEPFPWALGPSEHAFPAFPQSDAVITNSLAVGQDSVLPSSPRSLLQFAELIVSNACSEVQMSLLPSTSTTPQGSDLQTFCGPTAHNPEVKFSGFNQKPTPPMGSWVQLPVGLLAPAARRVPSGVIESLEQSLGDYHL